MSLRRIALFTIASVGIVGLLAVLTWFPIPRGVYWTDVVFDSGHVPLFGSMAILTLLLVDQFAPVREEERAKLTRQYLFAGAFTFAIGVAVEVVQGFTDTRNAEWIDIWNDAVGIIVALSCLAMIDPRWPRPRRGLLRRPILLLIAIPLLGMSLVPLARVGQLYWSRYQTFPELVKFDNSWRGKLYYARNGSLAFGPPPSDWPQAEAPADRAMLLTLSDGAQYPAFLLSDPYPDWSGYERLTIDLFLHDEQPRELQIRIHDRKHEYSQNWEDRFNETVLLQPGFQRIVVDLQDVQNAPQNRQMDMQRISSLNLFAAKPTEPIIITVGRVALSYHPANDRSTQTASPPITAES